MNLPTKTCEALAEIGQLSDEDLDLAETALILATVDRPLVNLDSYRRHLATLCNDVGMYLTGLPRPMSVRICHEALVQVLYRRYGYIGGEDSSDDSEAANLTHVIDRRSGSPVVLGVLYIHVADQLGWNVEGLNFPGRFLLRIEVNSERIIIDPFAGGVAINTHDLRGILKVVYGHHSELKPEYYRSLTAREILLRIQKNIWCRMLRSNRVDDAIEVIGMVLLFAPKETYLWREKAVLLMQTGFISEAIIALELFLRYDHGMDSRYKATILLQELRQRLN